MEMKSKARAALTRAAALGLAAALAAGCGAKTEEAGGTGTGGGTNGTQACGTVTLNENTWIGSTANVYVAKHVLENEFDCTVNVTKIAEIPAFQAMADGDVDAVLEDWQHTTEYKKYIDELGVVQDAGSLGITGHIGWDTPKNVVDEHPELESWEGLKDNWELFKTPESGDKGQLLDGDPSYVT